MKQYDMDRLGIHPSEYRFDHDRDLRVSWRGTGLWAIVKNGHCLNREREWEYEPLPSNRDQAFFERCRYTLDEALLLAVGKK